MNPSPLTPWRSSVRMLGIGRGISILGREAAAVAVALVLWQETGSPQWVAAAVLASELGYLAGAPLAGRLADRLDRRRVMIGSDLAGAGIVCCYLIGGPQWLLIALVALAGTVEAPFGAAARGALPNLVPDDALATANAGLVRWRTLGFLAGPLAGGAGVATIGADAVFVVDIASFALSALLVSRIRGSFQAPATRDDDAARGGLLAGARLIAAEPTLRAICGAWMLARIGTAVELTAAVVLGHQAGLGGVGVGLLIGAFGAGSLAGTTLAPLVLRRTGDAAGVVTGLAVIAGGLVCVGLAPRFELAVAAAVVAGVGDAISVVAEEGVLQRSTPDHARGRVGAAYEALLSASTLVALAGAGALVALLGAHLAYVAAGGVCFAAAAVAATPGRRARRRALAVPAAADALAAA